MSEVLEAKVEYAVTKMIMIFTLIKLVRNPDGSPIKHRKRSSRGLALIQIVDESMCESHWQTKQVTSHCDIRNETWSLTELALH